MPKFEPLKQGSIRSRIVEAVRSAIYSGHLKPGDPLTELQLARDFQVSQTPVREALFQLERLGLVRRVPNKGTFVTKLSLDEVRERLQVRVRLEVMAAQLAAARLSRDGVQLLERHVEEISAAILRNDYFESFKADLEFHRQVWTMSGNRTLYSVLDQIAAPMFAFLSIVRSSRLDNLKRVMHSHQEIVQALLGANPDTIRDVVEYHFKDSYDFFLAPDLEAANGLMEDRAPEAIERSANP
jgi:DNA-binding GntR family transcriptional regulator